MNIKISIYDFFAYTIPGILLLFSIAYTLVIFGFLPVDVFLFAPSITQAVIIIGLAYIVGLLFEPFGRIWYSLFRPKNHSEVVLEELRKRFPLYDVKFRGKDWTVLLAHIRRENPDIASEAERVNATNILLRNVSFGLILLAIIELVKFSVQSEFLHLIISVLLVAFSIIAGKEAVKFAQWFYLGIFENILSTALQLSKLVTIKEEKVKTSRR